MLRTHDNDLGQLLGGFDWQYDKSAILDAITVTDPNTGTRYYDDEDEDAYERAQEFDLDEALLPRDIYSIDGIFETLCELGRTPDETQPTEIDEEEALRILTEEDENGELQWKPLDNDAAFHAIQDAEIVGTGDEGADYLPTLEEVRDSAFYGGYLAGWANALDCIDRAQLLHDKIAEALATDEYVDEYKRMTRREVREEIRRICAWHYNKPQEEQEEAETTTTSNEDEENSEATFPEWVTTIAREAEAEGLTNREIAERVMSMGHDYREVAELERDVAPYVSGGRKDLWTIMHAMIWKAPVEQLLEAQDHRN